ncbi:magnesium chelatase subunit H [Roseiflexus castenholzii]|uniref:magnesium chelatase subunit H n=1 Tax=Roseiflexus castenholzii TaxID=120962 RepID=UPI003C7CB5CF
MTSHPEPLTHKDSAMRFVFLTMDGNHFAALREGAGLLHRDEGIALSLACYDTNALRTAADWQRLTDDVAASDFVFGSMLFGEDFVRPLEPILAQATAPVCIITSNPALIRTTRLGRFDLRKKVEEQEASLLSRWMHKFRPKNGRGEGQRQLALMRNLGRVLQHIPGKARDLATYVAVHQYWMHSSPENLRRMLVMLIERYVPGYQGRLKVLPPIEYPDVALLHPDAPEPFADEREYEKWLAQRAKRRKNEPRQGTVGLLTLRTVALSGNMAHLHALYRALEQRGLDVRMAYAAGLDFRPAIERFFLERESRMHWFGSGNAGPHPRRARIDALVNGVGFALVGGMAASQPDEAVAALRDLDTRYLGFIPLSFQRVEEWRHDDSGLIPIQVAMNVALPELDGAIDPLVFGGPTLGSDRFVPLPEQIELAAERIARHVALRRTPPRTRKLAIVLFNFPPTLGNAGTAAYLDVFASVHRLLCALRDAGYTVEVPASPEELRHLVVQHNADLFGTPGSVAARLSVNDYRRLFPAYTAIEPFWGAAPGELLTDGRDFFICGHVFGNVFVGLQPSFGYERDPMRLLMAKDAAPHHGFAAFYTWVAHVFGAHAVLHFGTHGALEFMPGKQTGLSAQCWPARLLGPLPNIYYYSVNNPSEGTIAKRRSAATLVSYMVPPLQQAGLYKGLRRLKDSLDAYRARPQSGMLNDIRAQAEQLGIGSELDGIKDDEAYVAALAHELLQIEQRMIPVGLHVLDEEPDPAELADVLALVAAFARPAGVDQPLTHLIAAAMGYEYGRLQAALRHDPQAQEVFQRIDALVRDAMRVLVDEYRNRALSSPVPGVTFEQTLLQRASVSVGVLRRFRIYLEELLDRMVHDHELRNLLHALDGGYIPPSPGNDVVRNPAVVPTGRNIHGLDPYRVPTAVAQATGERLVSDLLARLSREQGRMPESVAIVLWGTDNLKSDGEGIAQALALMGARPVADELGNISDVALIPLAELGRPRIDAVMTVSGIFRDLFSHQMQLLSKAARLAAHADEPPEWNYVRKHALAHAVELGISLDEAATRVFSNAPGSYGANVNHLVESSTWNNDAEMSEAFVSRKSFAPGAHGEWRDARAVLERALATVDATFQNVDSFEIGISDIDHYYEYLGGVTKSVEKLRGSRPRVLVAEALATTGERISTLEQQVRIETRAKLLNPKWFEAMLAHGYQGVHEIEARVGNTYGWSATADAVEGWVYQGVAETFMLDEAMRERLARLNPHAATAIAGRLLEAHSRGFWQADEATLDALQAIYADLEDRLEGVAVER